MKTTFFIAVLLGVLMTSTGCEQPKPPEEDTSIERTVEEKIYNVILGDVEIVIIDGCEYLIYKKAIGTNQGFGFMSHKGNCINQIHNYRTPGNMNTPP